MPSKIPSLVTFTDKGVHQIAKALRVEANLHRLSLLPRVLHEWAEVYLTEYASVETSRAFAPIEAARYKRIAGGAKELKHAIDAVIEAGDQSLIAFELGRAGRSIPNRERHEHFSQKLMEHRQFLDDLQAAVESLQGKLKKGPGQPRNIFAYLVILDLAAIFEWLTGRTAEREVDRMEGRETGAFYHFCAAVWPLVFNSETRGLPAAIPLSRVRATNSRLASFRCRRMQNVTGRRVTTISSGRLENVVSLRS
jgi:hypothetical protein